MFNHKIYNILRPLPKQNKSPLSLDFCEVMLSSLLVTAIAFTSKDKK